MSYGHKHVSSFKGMQLFLKTTVTSTQYSDTPIRFLLLLHVRISHLEICLATCFYVILNISQLQISGFLNPFSIPPCNIVNASEVLVRRTIKSEQYYAVKISMLHKVSFSNRNAFVVAVLAAVYLVWKRFFLKQDSLFHCMFLSGYMFVYIRV